MKAKIFLSTLFERWISALTTKREGSGINYQKWDNLYDSVICGRMERHSSK